eukprot:8835012-Alexandrium_andersonii.AAC.1
MGGTVDQETASKLTGQLDHLSDLPIPGLAAPRPGVVRNPAAPHTTPPPAPPPTKKQRKSRVEKAEPEAGANSEDADKAETKDKLSS